MLWMEMNYWIRYIKPIPVSIRTQDIHDFISAC